MNKLSAAIKYAELGFSVLPMNGKQPLIKFANRPPLTVDQIKYYWGKWPNANIALRTIDFFVVDIDTKKAHGHDGLTSIKNLPQGTILPTKTQQTSSGGFQMFYSKPKNGQVKQVIGLLPGIDIKAHKNNYVLVPPSTTDKGNYHWINSYTPIGKPSKLLVDMISNYHPQTSHQKWHYELGKKWTGIVLDNIVQGAPEGQRNDYMTRLCGQMIHAGAEKYTVWTLINYANQFNTPPLNDKELSRIVASVLREELKNEQ